MIIHAVLTVSVSLIFNISYDLFSVKYLFEQFVFIKAEVKIVNNFRVANYSS